MNSGVIYLAESDKELPEIREQVTLPDNHDYENLLEAVEVERNVELDSYSQNAQQGTIAAERVIETDDTRINEDSISEYTIEEKTVVSTDFLHFPGKFFAVSSSSGNFAIDVVNQHTGASIANSKVNIEGFIEQKLDQQIDIDPWKIGFYGKHGSIENGVVHGDSVLKDEDIGDVLDIADKNQIGLDYEYSGEQIRMFASESGYIEVYQPNDFTSSQFCEYVDNEILPVLKRE
ncbi:hypothetical protein [Natrinema sp. CGMCC1.2065]|uniref:hypothetical protein n=1 Tax=Natrinema sp. CGMCC1.2065 TaxID=3445767 RepID=UPI003F4A19BD